ncbi:Pkr1-domain-containing protein [Piedraia hortae CBS 480.64]|uniref:Pkr1-domain-containing protein n=1 Tax=Piedraia hortae CBS 480.64 TaxID=1314780 RepID=A0A6A7CA99_9PEZI|nr:Pkr1-domain-containing protein [Piedraia hortae CBS 480.64]
MDPRTADQSFVETVVNSILTAGPTPSLVQATHAAFLSLQMLLFLLLLATRSIHFAVLGCIAAMLWATVAWFITELERERERERQRVGGSENDERSEKKDTEKEKPPNTEEEEEGWLKINSEQAIQTSEIPISTKLP